jgi:hypothetical protein
MIKKFAGKLADRMSVLGVLMSLSVLLPVILFVPRLGSLIPANSLNENLPSILTDSGSSFYDNMLYAPVRAAEYGLSMLSSNIIYPRLLSGLVATIAALCLFLVLRRMSTLRIATLGTVMFITSSWVVHAARLANVEVLNLLVIPALLLVGYWATSKEDDKKLPISLLLTAVLLYVPGSWLFLVSGLIIFRAQIKPLWSKSNLKLRLAVCSLFALLMSPLIVSFFHNPGGIIKWLGVPDYSSLSLHNISSNILLLPDALFVRGPSDALSWLTGTPILDFFAMAMLILGCFAYRSHEYPALEKLIFSFVSISVILVAFGGQDRLGLVVPLLYILIGSGIAYLLQSWFTVFPRNPLARSIGLGLVIAAVLVSSSYQLQRYFIAWPNSPAIRQLRQ